jgi:hypothetical protein
MTDDPPPLDDESDTPRGDAFVDGRVDEEKLAELLAFPEGSHLEFKAELNLETTEGKVKFAKDVVAMSNCPPGGYILVGVDDTGAPCAQIGTFDRRRFESAQLADIVRGYVAAGHIELRVRINEYGGNEIVVIYVFPHPDGLPVPMSKVGNYLDPNKPGKQATVFREGDLPVREGAANVPLRHAHWLRILAAYSRQVRAEGTELAQAIIREFVDDRAQSRVESPVGRLEVPLLIDMDEPTFATAVRALLETEGDVRLRRFLRSVQKSVNSRTDLDSFETALDKWTVYCAQCLYVERVDLVGAAIDMLRDAYADLQITVDDDRRRLAVAVRLYALGSMAVREAQWSTVHTLALQPVPSNFIDSQYIYSSWLRHALVEASRANLLPDNRGGFLISAPRELLIEHPDMRPDVQDTEFSSEELAPDDVLTNSLCQFDLAYCFVVAAEGKYNAGGYPSSVALKEQRSALIAKRIVEKPDVRAQLFPESDDATIADAMAQVYGAAERESHNYRMWWDMPSFVAAFVKEHRAAPEK